MAMQLIHLAFFCFNSKELFSEKTSFVSCENNVDSHMLYYNADAR